MRRRSLTALAATTAPTLRALATIIVCAATTQCSQVIGLNEYYDCPGDSRCPADVLCHDGQKNGDESDVDCGGPCSTKCADGKGCVHDDDCESQSCGAGVCASCSDGEKNGKETDVDCGGACTSKCGDGKACVVDGDCASGSCAAGTCASCSDGKKNGKETDVDCGGACSTKCADGKVCVVDGDCANNKCDGGVCVSCSDGKKNGDETDIDCGGKCTTKCAESKACVVDSDCASGNCAGGQCTASKPCLKADDCGTPANECVQATCINGQCGTQDIADGTKTSQQTPYDCKKVVCDGQGGTKTVPDDTDAPTVPCTTSICSGGSLTQSPAGGSCSIDGGKVCADPTSANAGKCVTCNVATQSTDCPAGDACANNVCVPAGCTDGVWSDPPESDIDCGGPCLPCADGKMCYVNADCVSGFCGGGVCAAPPLVIGPGKVDTGGLAVDANNVYWTQSDTTSAKLLTVPVGGGTPVTLATGTPPFGDVAVDATNVYWVTGTTIMMVPIAGGGPSPLISGQARLEHIAVDASNVYWTLKSSSLATADGAVMKMSSASGGTPQTVASGQNGPNGLVIDLTNVYWINAGNPANNDGSVMSAPIAGGAAVTLASGQGFPMKIAVDTINVYWVTGTGAASLMKRSLSGGSPVVMVSSNSPVVAILADAANVYGTDGVFLTKYPVAGGASSYFATPNGMPQRLALDASYVYWTEKGGNVNRVHK